MVMEYSYEGNLKEYMKKGQQGFIMGDKDLCVYGTLTFDNIAGATRIYGNTP
ncbi:15793_t:CDS:2 [Gigaspora margarita]|uniref:15793_t:CDS:1 n=1 Tax=Gigaspora margarita TaxID=4874 RepID=A0ABM8W5R0_GIGMA|nr:15793_t:CDS:2 [Gigaspora margarita]